MIDEFTLVLLPGMLGTDELFGPFLGALPAGLRTLVVSYPTDVILSYEGLLRFIESRLQGEREMVILGESFSGPLALGYAANNPDRVRATILSASFVRPPLPGWLRWFAHPLILRIPLPSFLIRFFVAGKDASEGFLKTVRNAVASPSPVVLCRRIKDALSVDSVESLRRCTCPILYLAPTHDHLVRRFNLRAILKVRPDVRVAEIDGPHLILQTRSRESWQAIEDFISGR